MRILKGLSLKWFLPGRIFWLLISRLLRVTMSNSQMSFWPHILYEFWPQILLSIDLSLGNLLRIIFVFPLHQSQGCYKHVFQISFSSEELLFTPKDQFMTIQALYKAFQSNLSLSWGYTDFVYIFFPT